MHRCNLARALLAALAAAAVSAQAAPAAVEYDVEAEGAVTVTWRGDPGRGCEAARVCDLSGSTTLRVFGETSGGFSGGDDVEAGLESLDVPSNGGTARVIRGAPDAPAGVCTDFVTSGIRIGSRPPAAPGGRAELTLLPFATPEPAPVAGRCAGPLGSDLAGALPSVELDPRRLVRGRVRIDLSGRAPFAGGPYSGEVSSTVVLERTSRRLADEPGSRSRPSRRSEDDGLVRAAAVNVSLAVAGGPAVLRTGYRGAADPFCAGLDACGLTGEHLLRVAPGRRGTLQLFAFVRASALRGRRSERAVLAALRAGRLRAGESSVSLPRRATATATARASRNGAPACSDGGEVPMPELRAEVRAGALALRLGALEFDDFALDPLRTRCPGPALSDFAGGDLATAAVPLARLTRRRLDVRLRRPPALPGAYAVTARGAVPLSLRLRSVSVHFLRVPEETL